MHVPKTRKISNQKTQKQTEQKFYENLRSVAKSKTMAFRYTVESSVSTLALLYVYNFLASLCFEGMMVCSYWFSLSGILVVLAPSSWMFKFCQVHFGKADYVKVYFSLCHHYPILLPLNSRFFLSLYSFSHSPASALFPVPHSARTWVPFSMNPSLTFFSCFSPKSLCIPSTPLLSIYPCLFSF